MSSIGEKVKHALHLDKHSSSTTSTTGTTGHSGTSEGVAGPHSSRAANAADPRIDSDLDGSRNAGAAHNTTHSGVTGTTGTSGGYGTGVGHSTTSGGYGTGVGHSNTSGTAEGVHGPHSSRVANTVDPRVDSDRDGSRNAGAAYNTHSTHTGAGAGAYTSSHSGPTNTSGPHSSDLLNKADPRVDSDNSKAYGATSHSTMGTHTGTTGTHSGNTFGHSGTSGGISNSTNAGPHNSNLMNKADPTVDSDLSGRGNQHGTSHGGFMGSGTHATPGSGTTQNTAGPHNSDMMNKLDPRVDADLDGSKTIGGNKTYA